MIIGMVAAMLAFGSMNANAQGKYKGRKPIQIDEVIWKRNYDRYMNREINKGELCKVLKISRPTLEKLLKDA